MTYQPIVFIAVLAKQKETVLPYWLECLEALNYPKKRIILYVRSNNNTDNTETILRDWVSQHKNEYLAVHQNYENVDVPVEKYDVHEWNQERFSVLAKIRQDSIRAAMYLQVDYYFVIDVDNFLLPHTLRDLLNWKVDVVAPMLTYAPGGGDDATRWAYSNYHNVVDENGYFKENDAYWAILRREVRGLLDIDLVHCTYLIHKSVLPSVNYIDNSGRYEYVIFSETLRNLGCPQYLDNTKPYGTITLEENVDACRNLMRVLETQNAPL